MFDQRLCVFNDRIIRTINGTAVVHMGEHPTCTHGAISAGTVAPAQVVPNGAVARRGTWEHVPQPASCAQLSGYYSTRRASSSWRVVACGDERQCVLIACSSANTIACAERVHAWRVGCTFREDLMRQCVHMQAYLGRYCSTRRDARTRRDGGPEKSVLFFNFFSFVAYK